jgi:hypothetical protein
VKGIYEKSKNLHYHSMQTACRECKELVRGRAKSKTQLLVTDDEVQCLNKSVRECAYIQLGMNGIIKSCVCMDNSDKTRHLRCSSYDGHRLWREKKMCEGKQILHTI